MNAKADLRVTISEDLKRALDALSKATGQPQGHLVEKSLRLLLDPYPALVLAQKTLASHQQRTMKLEDKINLIADYVVDMRRTEHATN